MKKLLFLIFSILPLFSCAVNPVTGKKEIMVFSEADEIAIGKRINSQVLKRYPIYRDNELEKYISSVGVKIKAVSHRPNLPFRFGILDLPVPNAFAIPGGFIYVYRGALILMNNEAQLAAVLGHETGHVCARHAMKRLQLQLGATLLLNLASAASGSPLVVNAGKLFFSIIFSGYSRSEERQADELGVLYMWKAGYNPMEMSRFLELLLREEKYKPNFIGKIFATHPPTEERVRYTRALARRYIEESSGKKLKVLYNRFLRHLDGIPYGPGTEEGFIKGNTYLNGYYGISFKVPPGWKMVRSENRIEFGSRDGVFKGFLKLKTLGVPMSSIRYAEVVEKELRLKRLFGTYSYVSGRKAFEAEYKLGGFGAPRRILQALYYSDPERGWALSLFLVYPVRKRGLGLEFFYALKRNLRILSDEEKKKIPVYRLKIYLPKPGETFYSISKKFYGSTAKADELAVFNGFSSARDPIPPGRLIKIKPILEGRSYEG